MPKRRVWNVREMTDDELRALVRRCDVEEREARYRKGRRGWTRLRAEAKEELARREAE